MCRRCIPLFVDYSLTKTKTRLAAEELPAGWNGFVKYISYKNIGAANENVLENMEDILEIIEEIVKNGDNH